MDLDGFSLLLGGSMGLLLGWALTRGSIMRRQASDRLEKASKWKSEMERKKIDSRQAQHESTRAMLQSAMYSVFGLIVLLVLIFIAFNALA